MADKFQQKADAHKAAQHIKEIDQQPSVLPEANLIPIVTRPFAPPTPKLLQDDKYKNKLADEITDELMAGFVKNLIEIPSRKHRKKEL